MIKFIVTGIITILIIVGAIFLFSGEREPEFATNEDYFIAIVETALTEEYDSTVLGYEPAMIINTFGSLKNEDFAGVETEFGTYEVINGGISFRPAEGESFSEEKLSISRDGMVTFLNNLSVRLGIEVSDQKSIEDIIRAIQ